jgi:type I site-specific restriction-modification system R (restriction) subunit
VVQDRNNRRADIVVFVNGLPAYSPGTERRGKQGRRHLASVQATRNLQRPDPILIRLQWGARYFRRVGSPNWNE